eukprot:769575-Pyramimonas_sp.AAC.2
MRVAFQQPLFCMRLWDQLRNVTGKLCKWPEHACSVCNRASAWYAHVVGMLSHRGMLRRGLKMVSRVVPSQYVGE